MCLIIGFQERMKEWRRGKILEDEMANIFQIMKDMESQI